jgi:hypothetical protein
MKFIFLPIEWAIGIISSFWLVQFSSLKNSLMGNVGRNLKFQVSTLPTSKHNMHAMDPAFFRIRVFINKIGMQP